MPFAALGLEFSALRLASSRIRVGRGRIELLVRGFGAHPWVLERRNGLARGIYHHLQADDRSSVKLIPAEGQWRLSTLMSGDGFPAYQMVLGSNPADLYGWEDRNEDQAFAQYTSLSDQFAQQWKLRMMA